MTVKNQNKLLKVQNCALCMITYSQLDKSSHEATRQAYILLKTLQIEEESIFLHSCFQIDKMRTM